MRKSQIKTIAVAGSLALVLGAFQNCGAVRFQDAALNKSSAQGDPDPTANPNPPPPLMPPPAQVICDPFNQSNIIDPKLGIEGTIHYSSARLPTSECADPARCTSRDYIAKGTKIDAALFMSQIYVPTRNFSDGFEVQGAGKLKDANNNDLVEWFALDLGSNITLGAADADGMYQFATVSDDGVTLTANGQDILVDEGEHSPRLRCSGEIVPLKKGDLLPFRLSYFQGPRTQISLTLLWRKIEAQDLADCGSSDGYFTGQDTLPQGLTDRGWKVLKPENFKLKAGSNLCIK